MARDIDALTDKEKEALRLLLAGHDAKSSASELGISVHAVNDRLRNARRKLSVGSSREAARILGDAEGSGPQSQAHKPFGMEKESPPEDIAILDKTRPAGLSRSAWLTGGMLIMSIAIATVALFMFAGTGETPNNTASSNAPASAGAASEKDAGPAAEFDAQAKARANAFLAELDALDYEGSWQVAGVLFQEEVTAAEWEAQASPVRGPLGRVTSRNLATAQNITNPQGSPSGEYLVIQYQTVFANRGRGAIETLFMVKGPEGWEVTGYFIA